MTAPADATAAATAAPGQPAFTVTGIGLPDALPDLFGIWTARPASLPPAGPAAAAAPAGAIETGPMAGPRWQVVLPGDPAAARALLAAQQAAVEQQRQGLGYARRLLEDAQSRQKLHRRRQLSSSVAAAPVARPAAALLAAQGTPAAQAALAAMIAAPLLGPAALPAVPPPISPTEASLLQRLNVAPPAGEGSEAPQAVPGLALSIRLPWDQAVQFARQWQAFATDVFNLFGHYVDVETNVAAGAAGQAGAQPLPLGRTVVDWAGDFRTTWASGQAGEQMDLHLRSVRLALASRLALLHLTGTVAAGAVTLALSSPTVVAFVAALPAVFDAVKGAIQEYLALQKPDSSS